MNNKLKRPETGGNAKKPPSGVSRLANDNNDEGGVLDLLEERES
jgi:hypothetical protein